MKYEALYNLTIEQGGATVRVKDYPEKIVMPVKGFAVGNWSNALKMLHPMDMDPVGRQETFDTLLGRMLVYAVREGNDYIGTWLDTSGPVPVIHIDPVDVFASKDFALGVAYARGEQAVYDLANKREIVMRYKK